jgi:hypothetical protein
MNRNHHLKLIENLEENLDLLKSETDDILIRSEKAVTFCKLALSEMRKLVLQDGFENQQNEIEFFKSIKPQAQSKLIYHTQIFIIEGKRPNSSNKVQRNYLNAELDKLQIFTNDNLEFYNYYRCKTTSMDDHFFLRGKANIRLYLSTIHYLMDEHFCTSHDHTVAFIQAYDILSIYLKKELSKLETKSGKNDNPLKEEDNITRPKLFWTGTKIALIELIYALHSSGAINRGVIDIKWVVEFAERMFNINLDEPYHTFIEIKSRKKERTKFLDQLKNSLLKRLDESDQ